MIDFVFPDLESVVKVRDMVRKIANINAGTTTSDVFELSSKLNDVVGVSCLTVHLTEPQARALDLILDMFINIDADMVDEACNVSKEFKKIIAPSDVPRFIEVLRDNQLIRYLSDDNVQELFHDWCLQEGFNQLARDCMDLIISTGNIAWKMVYVWLCNNNSSNDTDVKEEMNKFEEAVCQNS